ncbi:glycoprotein 3-alpha-L-fucosyltransferase A-like isoform X2 [Contarinia nasturtii]|uniref:glycoprotein 3-alpha-L-fucosyltransferase A-like isoform X2 n=1 Tax=Contarinia nasturtii TaxID=265458 RepID=UPI0012D39EE0|nr:glycoprotein 3-alpha-L-fucosyltransferase A-like isoform X2 [Contarinia nasturtii]
MELSPILIVVMLTKFQRVKNEFVMRSPTAYVSLSMKKIIVFFLIFFVAIHFILWHVKQSSTKFIGKNVDIKPRERPWFFTNGGKVLAIRANFSEKLGRHDAKLMPWQDPGDRFENQLMFIPPNYNEKKVEKNKTILFYNYLEKWWELKQQWHTWFTNKKCPVNRCRFTVDRNETNTADLIVFLYQKTDPKITKQRHQVYAFFRNESPIHWAGQYTKSVIYNWTMTYRHDSTIAIPYSKWLYFDPRIKQMEQNRNYAENKTKKVAWLVSNCDAQNDRQIYVQKLQKYIDIDIYGRCGTKKCPKNFSECLNMVTKDYKFYLSFENSHCMDYITEKTYQNGLAHDVLPIVLGARREDYERQLPYNSFIYAEDFDSPKDLADYLHKVDKDDELYNSYFQWKGTGEIHNPFEDLWCRVCALLHDEYTMNTPHWYDDINKWFFNPETMRRGFWRDTSG